MEDDPQIREALAVLADSILITSPDEVLERVSARRRTPRWWARRGAGPIVLGFGAAAAASALVVGVLAMISDRDEPVRVDTGPAEPRPTSPPGWQRLWASGPRTLPSAAVSTGEQLALWGAATQGDSAPAPRLELWPFEPGRSDTEDRKLSSPAPVTATEAGLAVWTGAEIVVFDDGAAAAYNPHDDDWQLLPSPPASVARRPTVMVWTGREVITWGDRSRTRPGSGGAAWNPAEGRWRVMAQAPTPVNQGTGVWTGKEMVVVGAHLDDRNALVTSDAANSASAMAYDPATDRWRQLPEPRLSPQASTVAFTAGRLIAWDYVLDAASYDPDTNPEHWQRLPRLPLDSAECYPTTLAAGDQVFALYCGQAAVLDLRTAQWRPVQLPHPTPDGPLVWDGTRILVTAGSGPDGALWAATLSRL